jgi:hypothetical protein
MKYLILLLISVSTIYSASADIYGKFSEWPQGDERFPVLLSVTGGSAIPENRDPVQVLYVMDVSQNSAGNVRNQLIKGGIQLINSLRDKDLFGIVLYSKFGRTLFPLTDLTEDNRKRGIEILERVGTEKGRDLSAVIDRIENEFTTVSGVKSSSKFLVFTAHGAMQSGSSGSELTTKITELAERVNCKVISIGYGDEFDEDMMIESAEVTGGRSFYVDNDNTAKLQTVFSKLVKVLPMPQDTGLTLYLTPEEGLEIHKYGADNSFDGEVHIPTISTGQTRHIWLEVSGNPKKSRNLDVDFDYYDLSTNSELNLSTMLKIPVASKGSTYNKNGATHLISYGIHYNLAKTSPELLKGGKNFRKGYAANFKTKIIDEVDVARNQIGTPEIHGVYNIFVTYYNHLIGGAMSTNRIVKKFKYGLHSLNFGLFESLLEEEK